jgi:BirA family biotin operon repressor/biotin-[acetyl-CoA-carboxylase] ligase
VLQTCSSTNDVAAQLAGEGAPDGFTVIAEEQRTGRGRFGRPWLSPIGGIWMTIVLRGLLVEKASNNLALMGALATAKGIHSNLGVDTRVRWPNDVVFTGRKLAGVTVETKMRGNEFEYALLGIGINVNFPTNLLEGIPNSTTLLEIVGSPVDREQLVCTILAEIERLKELLLSAGAQRVLEILERFDCSRGKHLKVTVHGFEISGVFAGYDELSRVVILLSDGRPKKIDTTSVISAEYING